MWKGEKRLLNWKCCAPPPKKKGKQSQRVKLGENDLDKSWSSSKFFLSSPGIYVFDTSRKCDCPLLLSLSCDIHFYFLLGTQITHSPKKTMEEAGRETAMWPNGETSHISGGEWGEGEGEREWERERGGGGKELKISHTSSADCSVVRPRPSLTHFAACKN